MTRDDPLLDLAVQFALLSLIAVGGANTVVPEMHRQAVEIRHWVGDRQFGELYAIAQAAPGPNVMIVALIGQVVAGPLGAVVAMAAMCAPTAVLACAVSRLLDRRARWRELFEAALVPITVGLVAATAVIVTRAVDHDLVAIVITVAAFALTAFTRVSPLLVLAGAAIAGFAGWV